MKIKCERTTEPVEKALSFDQPAYLMLFMEWMSIHTYIYTPICLWTVLRI